MRHDSHYVDELLRTNKTIGRIIAIGEIAPNPEQPRTEIGDLEELTSSIKEKGVLEPLLVKPKSDGTFMIIAGERRWRAANLAGLSEVPCIELDLDEKEIAEIALIENMQRKDLTVWEEADGLAALKIRYGYNHEEIARKLGKSRSTVTESLTIAKLPESIREKCRKSDINAKSTLLEIARQFDEEAMHNFMSELTSASGNREKVRLKSRAQSSTKNDHTSNQTSKKIDEPVAKKTYSYQTDDFHLEIKFQNNFEKKDVLKALKAVFENVKSDLS